MQDYQEFPEELTAFFIQVFLGEVDEELVGFFVQLESNDFGLLVLVQVLRENVCTLCVGLAPFVSLWVVESQAEDTFTELVHNIDPQHLVNLMGFESKQGVHLGRQPGRLRMAGVSYRHRGPQASGHLHHHRA